MKLVTAGTNEISNNEINNYTYMSVISGGFQLSRVLANHCNSSFGLPVVSQPDAHSCIIRSFAARKDVTDSGDVPDDLPSLL